MSTYISSFVINKSLQKECSKRVKTQEQFLLFVEYIFMYLLPNYSWGQSRSGPCYIFAYHLPSIDPPWPWTTWNLCPNIPGKVSLYCHQYNPAIRQTCIFSIKYMEWLQQVSASEILINNCFYTYVVYAGYPVVQISFSLSACSFPFSLSMLIHSSGLKTSLI